MVDVLTVVDEDCIEPSTEAPAMAAGTKAVPEPGYVVLPTGVMDVGAENT